MPSGGPAHALDDRILVGGPGHGDPVHQRRSTNSGATDVDDLLVETAEQLAGVGVTYLYGGVLRPVDSRAEFLDEVIRMGETLVPRLATIATQRRIADREEGDTMSDTTVEVTSGEGSPRPALDRLLSPQSIVMVGASNKVANIGGHVFANLVRAFPGR